MCFWDSWLRFVVRMLDGNWWNAVLREMRMRTRNVEYSRSLELVSSLWIMLFLCICYLLTEWANVVFQPIGWLIRKGINISSMYKFVPEDNSRTLLTHLFITNRNIDSNNLCDQYIQVIAACTPTSPLHIFLIEHCHPSRSTPSTRHTYFHHITATTYNIHPTFIPVANHVNKPLELLKRQDMLSFPSLKPPSSTKQTNHQCAWTRYLYMKFLLGRWSRF